MDRSELIAYLESRRGEATNFAKVGIQSTILLNIIDELRSTAWRPMSEAPETGVFLVLLERDMLGSRVHAANWRPNVKTIGGVFSFDAPKPVAWQPLPPPPTGEVVG